MFEIDGQQRFGHAAIWQAFLQVDNLVDQVLSAPKGKAAKRAHRRTLLLLLLTKGLKTYHAIQLLCLQGYGQDAMLLMRSFFELVVTAQYLTQTDTRQRVAQFRAYYNILSAQLIDVRKNDPTFVQSLKERGARTLRKIGSDRQRAKRRFPFFRGGAMGWTGSNLEQVAAAVGQKGAYDSLYRLSSQFEHPSFFALHRYVFPAARTIAEAVTPSREHVNQVLASLFIEMLILLEVIIRAFRLGMYRELKALSRLVPDVTARVRQ